MSRTLQFYDYVGADNIADKDSGSTWLQRLTPTTENFSVIRDMLSKKMDESDSSDDEKFQNFAPGSVDEGEGGYDFKITCAIM